MDVLNAATGNEQVLVQDFTVQGKIEKTYEQSVSRFAVH